jgi:proline iminopeptidase
MRLRLHDNTRLFVDVVGALLRIDDKSFDEVPTVLMVHGGPGSDHSALRPFFEPLADAAQVVFFDQRGMGRSDQRSAEEWNLDTWTDDLLELVDRLGLGSPVVIAQSFGGYVAIRAAAQRPDAFSALVLSSAQAVPDPADSVERFRALGGDSAGAAASAFFTNPQPSTYAAFREFCNPLYNPTPRDPLITAREISTPEVLFHFWSGEYRELDLRAELPRITLPTLILAGDQDPIIPAERSLELAQGLVNAERLEAHVIAHAGHGPYRDDPQEYQRLLREFLASVAQRPRPALARAGD